MDNVEVVSDDVGRDDAQTYIIFGYDVDGNYVREEIVLRGTKPVESKTRFRLYGGNPDIDKVILRDDQKVEGALECE